MAEYHSLISRLLERYTALEKPEEAKRWKLEWAKYACETLAMPREK